MTKYILSLAIAALLVAGCGNKKSNEHSHDGEAAHEHTEGMHKHEDGSVHEDHHDAEHHQEEFKVESDSSAVNEEKELEHGHSHEDGSHKH
jgi:putative ABC transport system permease protein